MGKPNKKKKLDELKVQLRYRVAEATIATYFLERLQGNDEKQKLLQIMHEMDLIIKTNKEEEFLEWLDKDYCEILENVKNQIKK